MPNLTEVGISGGRPNSGTGTVSTIDALIAIVATAAKQEVMRPTPEERYRMVQTAAYFIAERNGFGGCSTMHWVDAEREISAKLGE